MSKLLQALAVASVAMISSSAHATEVYDGVWQLENRGTGGRLGSDYGFGSVTSTGWDLFDFERNGADVKLTYDSANGVVTIKGQAYSSESKGLVGIDLKYSGVTGGDEVGTQQTEVVGTINGVEVIAKPSASAKAKNRSLFLDSLTAEGSFKGTGWLGTDAGHFGDFHFSGDRIKGSAPAPGGIVFLLLAGAALVARQRKKPA